MGHPQERISLYSQAGLSWRVVSHLDVISLFELFLEMFLQNRSNFYLEMEGRSFELLCTVKGELPSKRFLVKSKYA
jgi:hypothetical protein